MPADATVDVSPLARKLLAELSWLMLTKPRDRVAAAIQLGLWRAENPDSLELDRSEDTDLHGASDALFDLARAVGFGWKE